MQQFSFDNQKECRKSHDFVLNTSYLQSLCDYYEKTQCSIHTLKMLYDPTLRE